METANELGVDMANINTVREIYQAFGQGDVAAIVDRLADDVEWEYGVNSTNVPWLQPRRGKARVPEFFQALADIDIHKFEPTCLLEQGNTVVALINLDATVRGTQQRVIEEDEAHIWHFDAHGKVSRFRHRADTHLHWMVYNARS